MKTEESVGVSLWNIETALLELVAFREEAQTDEERQAADDQIQQYVAREVTKVDNIRAFVKHCELVANAAKEEAAVQTERQRIWEARRARVMEMARVTMEMAGLKRLEGRTGSLLRKANGGVQPVDVSNPEMLPEEYADVTVKMPLDVWTELCEAMDAMPIWESVGPACPASACHVAPNLTRIRETLLRGEGVPGASLRPRGEHLECK